MENREELESKPRFFILLVSLLFSPQSLITFPTWIKQHGGVAVIMPYTVCVLVLGIPMVFLELSIGQFMQRSGTRLWGLAPLFKGIGISSMFSSILRSSLNMVVASWAGFYIYLTLTNQLPSCKTMLHLSLQHSGGSQNVPDTPSWSTSMKDKHMIESISTTEFPTTVQPGDVEWPNSYSPTKPMGDKELQTAHSMNSSSNFTWTHFNRSACHDAFVLKWRNEVLEATTSITPPGQSVLHIFIGGVVLAIVSTLVVILGVGAMSRILAVLTPISVMMAVVLFVQAFMGDSNGVHEGLAYLWHPDFQLITHPDVWLSCCHQVLITHSLSVGVLPSMASYLRWNNNSFSDTMVTCLLSALINVLTALLIFAIMGSSAELDSPNPFTTITLAFSLHSYSKVWTVLFFVFIIIVIITTNAVYWDSAALTFTDASTKLAKWRVLIVIGVAALVFLLTIPMSLQSGIYSFHLLNYVTFGPFLVGVICWLECVVMAFIYGGHKFYDNLETMTLHEPHWWMRFCWAWLCPPIILACLCYHGYVVSQNPLSLGEAEPYHHLANMLVLILVCMLLLPIPLTAVWVLCSGPVGCVKKIKWALHPRLQPFQIPIRWRLEGKWHKFSPL